MSQGTTSYAIYSGFGSHLQIIQFGSFIESHWHTAGILRKSVYFTNSYERMSILKNSRHVITDLKYWMQASCTWWSIHCFALIFLIIHQHRYVISPPRLHYMFFFVINSPDFWLLTFQCNVKLNLMCETCNELQFNAMMHYELHSKPCQMFERNNVCHILF